MSEKNEDKQIENKELLKLLELCGWAYEQGFEDGRVKTTKVFQDFYMSKQDGIQPDTEKMMKKLLDFHEARQKGEEK